MNIFNVFFSPTDTTGRISSAVAAEIASGLNADLINVDVTKPGAGLPAVAADDVVVIASPVYGGKMAPIAAARAEAMAASGANCVLIAVYGNRAFENALRDMAAFAARHGLTAIAAGAFVGEHSYSTSEHPIASGRPDDLDFVAAKEFGARIAAKISAGNPASVDVAALADVPSPEESLANFRAFVASYVEKQKTAPVKLLPETDESKCSYCGTCISVCPTGAIDDNCTGIDPALCIKCCACVKACPSGARTLSSPFAPVLSANFNRRKCPVWMV